MKQKSAISIIFGTEPNRAVPNLEQYRSLPRAPGQWHLVFGWTNFEGVMFDTKVCIKNMTLAILRTHEARVQQGLNTRYRRDGSPPVKEFTERLAIEMAQRLVTALIQDFPEVGATTRTGRSAVAMIGWLVLNNPAMRAAINYEKLITLQMIFAWSKDGQRFLPMVSADHGDAPPRKRH